MKGVRKLTALVLLLCILVGSMHAAAADELLGTTVDGSLLTEETSVETTVYPKARWSYMNFGTGSLSIKSGRTLSVGGCTTAYRVVDSIMVILSVQKLESGSWKTVYFGPTAKATNDSLVTSSFTCTVEGGYYYRVYGAHSVTHDGTTEAVTSHSDGIWVP